MLGWTSWPLTVGLGLLAGLITFAAVPPLCRLAYRNGLMDVPGGRKRHPSPTPTCGGIAIFFGLIPIFLGLITLSPDRGIPSSTVVIWQVAALFVACVWMLVLGTLDDRYNLNWTVKLGGQIVGILILVLGGHSMGWATIPLVGRFELGWAGILVFGGIVILITNAVNLIDGLDAVAVGICFFAALAGGVSGVIQGHLLAATLQFSVAAALAGFLPYNWPPARVFLGDGGSMMLGLLLATMGTSSAFSLFPGQRMATFATLVAPFLPFFLALLDVALAMLRRWIRGNRIYHPDTDHLHHRLAAEFQSPKRVIALIYSFSAAFAALSVVLVANPDMGLWSVGSCFLGVAVTGLGVVLLRVYRVRSIGHLSRVVSERSHFKFLDLYRAFMTARLARARSITEALSMLGSGVTDLGFDTVTVVHRDACIGRWEIQDRVHPQSERSTIAREIGSLGLAVVAVVPQHGRSSYQECLEAVWTDFLRAFEERIMELDPESVFHTPAKTSES